MPVLSMAMFWRQRDFFAIAVCFGWLSENLFDVATYAGDARSRHLHLITPGGDRGTTTRPWLEEPFVAAERPTVAVSIS